MAIPGLFPCLFLFFSKQLLAEKTVVFRGWFELSLPEQKAGTLTTAQTNTKALLSLSLLLSQYHSLSIPYQPISHFSFSYSTSRLFLCFLTQKLHSTLSWGSTLSYFLSCSISSYVSLYLCLSLCLSLSLSVSLSLSLSFSDSKFQFLHVIFSPCVSYTPIYSISQTSDLIFFAHKINFSHPAEASPTATRQHIRTSTHSLMLYICHLSMCVYTIPCFLDIKYQ